MTSSDTVTFGSGKSGNTTNPDLETGSKPEGARRLIRTSRPSFFRLDLVYKLDRRRKSARAIPIEITPRAILLAAYPDTKLLTIRGREDQGRDNYWNYHGSCRTGLFPPDTEIGASVTRIS